MLDPRIQRIFYRRLKSFGFVNPRYHPEKLQTFSSVVINGGGSWQQKTDWDFPKGTRFHMDTAAVPFMVEVRAETGALECDGVYVATTTKQNGKSVYVQVSKHEFNGFKGEVAFKECMQLPQQRKISQLFLNSEGKREDACSPRVLVCCGEDKWGIQLLPGYGTQFFIYKFDWNQKLCTHVDPGANAFSSMNFDKFEANFRNNSSLTVQHIHNSASSVLTRASLKAGHCFSFGPMKRAKSGLDPSNIAKTYKPTAILPQGYHSDGPNCVNRKVFDENGNLLPDAPACRKKTSGQWTGMWDNPLSKHLPQHLSILQESFSALFGVFKGTYIQTPPSPDCRDRSIEALNVDIPLGCAIVFTFAWKHRGKGDDGHVPTEASPVAVHARPHFYCYSSDLRRLPTIDLEATLEFLSFCALKEPDAGSLCQMLDTLQTFDRLSAEGEWDAKDVHSFFLSQQQLEAYVSEQLAQQLATKKKKAIKECHNWILKWSDGRENTVALIYSDAASASEHSVDIASACFDSDQPSFSDSEGTTYNLVGPPRAISEVPTSAKNASNCDSDCTTDALPMVASLMESLHQNWFESHLVRLLSMLDAYAKQCMILSSPLSEMSSPASSTTKRIVQPQQAAQAVMIQTTLNDFVVQKPALRFTRRSSGAAASTAAVASAPPAAGLPDFARSRFPPGVPSDQINWKQWADCMITGVGMSQVWNVYNLDKHPARNGNRVFDSIAIKLLGSDETFNIEEKTIHYDHTKNQVICAWVGKIKRGEQRPFVHFQDVCHEFRDWACTKMPQTHHGWHNTYFRENDLVLVECGGNGDCLYHACLFLIQMFLPKEFREGMTHAGLRTATVDYLETHHKLIQTPDGPLNLLLEGAGDCADDDALQVLVAAYCKKHRQVGTYEEDPSIRAFAHMMGVTVLVHHTSVALVLTINEKQVGGETLTLWCNGHHYKVSGCTQNPTLTECEPSPKL